MTPLKVVFWTSAGLIAWTHVGYPLAATALARLRPRAVRREELSPRVTVIVAAHDEEAVIERRLENLLALEYPADRFDVIVASDASGDQTDEIVERFGARDGRVRLLRCPRGGKVAAQNLAARETDAEILAFSDATSVWERDALARLVRSFADPDVGYVCGQLRWFDADGRNPEGRYWRLETKLRAAESDLGSITGGVGPIYAVRREDFIEVDPRFGHDLSFPYAMVQRGRRAVYEPDARAYEKPTSDAEEEARRKARMFEHGWLMLLRGGMLRGVAPRYALQLVSHRHLRYSSGLLHVALLAATLPLARRGSVYRLALATQLGVLALAAGGKAGLRVPGANLALYYVLVSWGTAVSLVRYLRRGVPAVWDKAAGTR